MDCTSMNCETIKISNTGKEMTVIYEGGEYYWEDESGDLHPILESDLIGEAVIECAHCKGDILNSFNKGDFVECDFCEEIILVK